MALTFACAPADGTLAVLFRYGGIWAHSHFERLSNERSRNIARASTQLFVADAQIPLLLTSQLAATVHSDNELDLCS